MMDCGTEQGSRLSCSKRRTRASGRLVQNQEVRPKGENRSARGQQGVCRHVGFSAQDEVDKVDGVAPLGSGPRRGPSSVYPNASILKGRTHLPNARVPAVGAERGSDCPVKSFATNFERKPHDLDRPLGRLGPGRAGDRTGPRAGSGRPPARGGAGRPRGAGPDRGAPAGPGGRPRGGALRPGVGPRGTGGRRGAGPRPRSP